MKLKEVRRVSPGHHNVICSPLHSHAVSNSILTTILGILLALFNDLVFILTVFSIDVVNGELTFGVFEHLLIFVVGRSH